MTSLSLEKISNAHGIVTLPGSKSISNRVLLLAALSEGNTRIGGLLDSDDVTRMKASLTTLGITMEAVDRDTFIVHGTNGEFPVKKADLFLGNAGTAFRPLTAALALNQGTYNLTGVARMHERPIKDLVDALLALGLSVDYLENSGYPPLKINSSMINKQRVTVKGSVSSQFLTALLLALPMTKKEMMINVEGELISKPYIDITLNLLKTFGITVMNNDWKQFVIPANSHYQSPREYYVEGDASSASYFLAMGAIGGHVTVKGVGQKSIQGDVKFVDALEKMGALIEWQDYAITVKAPPEGLVGIDLDCNHIPDAAMTLAIVALFAKGKTTLRNIASWRVKETDRISAMVTELTKLGVRVEEGADYIVVDPPEKLKEQMSIATYDDHRIAMCFSLCAFKVPIIIEEPHCVDKTFPSYFEYFKTLVS